MFQLRRRVGWLAWVMFAMVATAACSSGGGATGGGSSSGVGFTPDFISIGTAPTGASFYPLGVAMAEIIKDQVGIPANAEPTGASIENINLIVQREAELGFVMSDTAAQAVAGEEAFEGKPVEELRVLFAGHTLPFIMVTRADANIDTIQDIKGKRAAANMPRASSNRLALTAVLESYGMSWDDAHFVDLVSLEDAVGQVKDGSLDGVWYPVAPGSAVFVDLANSIKTHWISFDHEHVNQVLERYPFYTPLEVPQSTNEGQDQDLVTFGPTALIVTTSELSEDVAYQITKAVLENLDQVALAHPAGKEFNLEKAASAKGIDYHPGAIRYYKEQGVWPGS